MDSYQRTRQEGLIVGFFVGIIFSVLVVGVGLKHPGPALLEWCEEVNDDL